MNRICFRFSTWRTLCKSSFWMVWMIVCFGLCFLRPAPWFTSFRPTSSSTAMLNICARTFPEYSAKANLCCVPSYSVDWNNTINLTALLNDSYSSVHDLLILNVTYCVNDLFQILRGHFFDAFQHLQHQKIVLDFRSLYLLYLRPPMYTRHKFMYLLFVDYLAMVFIQTTLTFSIENLPSDFLFLLSFYQSSLVGYRNHYFVQSQAVSIILP